MAKPSLSVLIPVYNFSVGCLVDDLLSQLEKSAIDFEIRLYDDYSDASTKELNGSLAEKSRVIYKELPQNIGRSKIRNLLALDAVFDFLLFLDCDCELPNGNYIQTYISLLNANAASVLNGGRLYKPFNYYKTEHYLHWLAGKNKEEKLALLRNASPYGSFMLDNLLIKKSIFTTILLDELIKTYGHEDTKFGFDLEKRAIPVLHIENQTYHIGLSTAQQFLEKTKLAVIVLCQMIAHENIGKSTPIYKSYQFLKTFRLSGFAIFMFYTFKNIMMANLISKRPSLLILDLFKLGIMVKQLQKLK